jgi:hypothetical protein
MNKFSYLLLLTFLKINELLAQKSQNFELIIEHYFGNQPLKFDQAYPTESGDTIYINKLQYYLSNFCLKTADGMVWQEPSSYHLLKLEEGKNCLKIDLNPAKTHKQAYTSLSFGLGIDSLRNHAGAQTADLDPINGMFWTWEQGYIFFKCEGYYFLKSASRRGLIYHLGRDVCYREVQVDLPAHTSQITLKVDLKKLFGGLADSAISLKLREGKASTNIMGGEKASKLADNWQQMFLRQ